MDSPFANLQPKGLPLNINGIDNIQDIDFDSPYFSVTDLGNGSTLINANFDSADDLTHTIEQNPYELFTDDFDRATIGNEWQIVTSEVNSTAVITDDALVITRAGANSYNKSSWQLRNAFGRNFVSSVQLANTGSSGLITFAEEDSSNLGAFILDATSGAEKLRILKRVSGTPTLLATGTTIAGFSATAGYYLHAKRFNNHHSLVLTDSSGSILDQISISNDSDLTSTLDYETIGLSTAYSSGGAATIYDNFSAQRVSSFTNIVCLGDSNTYSDVGAYGIAKGNYYPAEIQTSFISNPVAVLNKGVSGDTIADVTARLAADLTAHKVDGARNICTLLIGTNDIAAGGTGSLVWASLASLIEDIQDVGFEPWVMTYPPYDNYNSSATITGYNAEKEILNNLIRNNAQNLGYKVIDLWSEIVDSTDDDRIAEEYRLTDNYSHWNDTAQLLIANKLIDLIELPREVKYLHVDTLDLGLTTGSVVFADSNGNMSEDNDNLFWDNSNNRLGIGTATPATFVNIEEEKTGISRVRLQNTSTASASVVGSIYEVRNDNDYWGAIGITNSGSTIQGGAFVNTYQNYNQGYGNFIFTNDGNVDFVWYSDPTDSHDFSALGNEIMRLSADGKLTIQASDTIIARFEGTTANGHRIEIANTAQEWEIGLDDDEDFIIQDVTGGTIPMTIQNGAPANSILVEGTGDVGIGGIGNPAARLDVKGSTNDGSTDILNLKDSSNAEKFAVDTDGVITSATWQGVAIDDLYISSAATWNAKQDALTFGIANTNAVKIDGATVADNDYAKFTTTGLEGRSYSEVKTDLSLGNVENTALSTWAGTSNITTLGTIATGTWNAGIITAKGTTADGSTNIFVGLDSTDAEQLSLNTDGKLTIQNDLVMNNNRGIKFYNTTPALRQEILATASNDLRFYTGGHVEALRIDTSGNVKILNDSKNLYFGAGTDASINYDGTNLNIDSSLVAPSDIILKCGTDKTLVLNETVWDDINLGAAQLSRPASSQPDLDTFVDSTGTDTGIQTYAFAVGEKIHGSFELIHSYKEGTDLKPHLHFQIIDAPSGTDNVRWRMTYTIAKAGTTLGATATTEGECAVDTQYENHFCELTDISGTGLEIGDQFLFTLERIASSGDAFAGDALIQTVGVHYQVDTMGSRAVSSK